MIIALKTSYSSSLGMGHIQRMCSLAWYMNELKGIRTFIVSDAIPDSFPNELSPYLRNSINFSPDIIIRDMRDSAEEEIILLRKIGKVITIDDNGPGAKQADSIIDILPNPAPHDRAMQFHDFLFGFNFLHSLAALKNKIIKKDIDFSIYPGNSASDEYKNFLISLLPERSSFAMLCGRNSYFEENGKKSSFENISYAEVLLSSKTVISHFGVTLFEAFISKCRSIAINPTKYHSELSDMVKEKRNLINLGEFENLNSKDAARTIKKTLRQPAIAETINAEEVYNIIINGLEKFYKILISF